MSKHHPVLSLSQLSIRIGEDDLVKKITFDMYPGEIFALVGESGSGKSLTSLAVMRLLAEGLTIDPDSGIRLADIDLMAQSERQMQTIRGKRVAMIFQEPMTSLNPVIKVGEQVAEVLRLHLGLKSKQAKAKVVELFNEVGIPDAAERYNWYPHQLSGGQKQRVMIAMALACEPQLLIADEPTTALDVTIQAQVLNLLKQLRDERGLAILFITHDMGVVYDIADTVAVMRKGELVELAHKELFFERPRHSYTKQLLKDSIPQVRQRVLQQKQALLELDDLQVHFPVRKGIFQRKVADLKAVDGVTLEIAKGETLALVGESGSGKSTIGQAILRLVNTKNGQIRWLDQKKGWVDLGSLKERDMRPYRKQIQVIFQDPFSALNPRMTVLEIIREGMVTLQVGSQDPVEQEARVDKLLLQVGLFPEHKERYPHEFSGGQRQRIGIARALAVEPDLIICDEPTSALDVSVRAQVLKLLDELQQKYGLSYLFITHDLSIVPTIAHKVAVMQQGKIVESGTVEEVIGRPQHPYTRQLLDSAPSLVKQRIL
ncbi:ABC transporter ATP-binding protein [Thiomicrorhabdus heinhorstiae]|uniref:ABC transporter ATP-binding protein n=1 Tax=Thiomicrorhabdus heinhorstiae TaxID=2748010 RepID=A0ABS0BVU2_9GAMM|nr:dipeptide ABC transporter ATP-binding protein [Thiomicrorhabdus heinhorstiae]MBF6056916.1 ABC transporter ATP-binding protein [Thiomicrorhabdus heinhorstiae]